MKFKGTVLKWALSFLFICAVLGAYQYSLEYTDDATFDAVNKARRVIPVAAGIFNVTGSTITANCKQSGDWVIIKSTAFIEGGNINNIYNLYSGTVVVTDINNSFNIIASSGIGDKIMYTNATNGISTITLSGYLVRISFQLKNITNPDSFAVITTNCRGSIVPIADGDSTGEIKFDKWINNPIFYLTLPVGSTIQYDAQINLK
jgi:hypothetical protein